MKRVLMDASTLIWGLVFGSIGLGYFIYGKKQSNVVSLLCGMALMAFPYFISNIFVLIILGLALVLMPVILENR